MAVPEFQNFLLPLLRTSGDALEHRVRDLIPILATELGLNDEDRAKLLPSGGQTVVANRVFWAATYLRKAGLLTAAGRGTVRISEEGRRVLLHPPQRIDKAFLSQYASFREFAIGAQTGDGQERPKSDQPAGDISPEERIESGWEEVRAVLAQDLLSKVKAVAPRFFERLVVDLLLAMGYGGSRTDASKLVGRPGDAGIDGTIAEDKLGLDVVYVQAKRWDAAVGRETVQAFAGSLEGFRARKGVLITTSHFTPHAHEYVKQIEKRIVLIDGARLVELMIEHGVGVETSRTYEIKKVDLDYFEGETSLE